MADANAAKPVPGIGEPTLDSPGSIILIAAHRWTPSLLAWVCLLATVGVVAFWSLLPGPTLNDHECLVAQTSREMMDGGDWIVPHFSGMPRLQKSPLAYWSVVAASRILGRFSDPVVRLPSALYAVALAGLMALFAWRAFGSAALAWFCGAVTAFSAVWLFYSHVAIVDMQLTFWCTAAGMLLWLGSNTDSRSGRIGLFAGAGAAMGMGMLAKMPMPPAVLLPGFLVYLLATGRGRKIGTYLLDALPGIAVMLLVWLPWVVLVLQRVDSQAVGLKWFREFISRAEGDVGNRVGPWHYYLARLCGYLLPWTLSLPEALASPWLRRYRPWRDVLIFAFCMAILNLAFFSVPSFYKRDQYLLPAMPWFLLLLTPAVWRFFAGPVYEHPQLFRRCGLALAAIAIIGAVAGWLLLNHRDPSAASVLAVPMGVLVAGIVLMGVMLAAGARLESFYALILTIAVTFCLVWNRDRLPAYMTSTQREHSFAQEVRRIVPPGAKACYLGNPDPRLVYYGGLSMPRVLSDLETGKQVRQAKRQTQEAGRQVSQSNSQIGQIVTAQALIEQFKHLEPIYVVSDFGKWQMLWTVDQFRELGPSLLYHQTGFEQEQERDLVVFGNAAAATGTAVQEPVRE